jgi:hypothetical protein
MYNLICVGRGFAVLDFKKLVPSLHDRGAGGDFSSCNLYKTKIVVEEEEQKLHTADILKTA